MSQERDKPVPTGAKYVTARQVLARYGGRSAMWLHRKLRDDPSFPRPKREGRLRLFEIRELEEYEQNLVAG